MKRALVHVGQGVGNVVMATPAIRLLNRVGYAVDVIALGRDARYLDLLQGAPFVEHLYGGEHPHRAVDLILHTAQVPKPDWNAWLHKDGRQLCAPSFGDLAHDDKQHESLLNCRPLADIGIEATPMLLPCVAAKREQPSEHVVLAPGRKPENEWAKKDWQASSWIGLSLAVRQMGYVPVALGHRPEETAWAYEGRSLDLGGLTRLRDAVAIIAKAKAMVSIDNGLAHVAAALGVPLVVLWGPTNHVKSEPRGTGPIRIIRKGMLCSPCQFTDRWRRPCEGDCMKHNVAYVLSIVKGVLNE